MKTVARYLVVSVLLLAPLAVPHAAEARRPNVTFILTDDQGRADARFAGHPGGGVPVVGRANGTRRLHDLHKAGAVAMAFELEPEN